MTNTSVVGICVCLMLLASESAHAQIVQPADMHSLLAAVTTQHPTLRAREAEVGATQSDVESARWQFWPTPSVSLQRPDKALIAGNDRSVSTLSLRQPLWTGGRLEAGVAYAGARKQTAEAIREEVRRDLALELIQAYGEAHTARARLKVYDTSLGMHRKLFEQIQRRARAGLSVESDIALARSRQEAVVADRANARAAFDAALERLRTLVGHPVAETLAPLDALPAQILEAEASIQQALQIDPSLRRLQSEVQELRAHADSAASASKPDVYANISRRHGDVTGASSQIFIGLETKWGAGLSNASTVQAAQQRLLAKQEEIDYRTRRLAEQIRSDLRQRASTNERIKAFQDALGAANVVADSWDRQFNAGKKAWQDVMNAARESAQTEIQLVDATGLATVVEWRLALITHGVQWLLQPQQDKP